MPDFVGKRKHGHPKKDGYYKSTLEVAMKKKKKGTKRKWAEDDDGLGLDDVEFGFGVDFDGEENVDRQEGEI
jgi:hypothetical protein